MAEVPYGFAIFGSTPLAGLLAGLLASVHRKRVCLVAEAGSTFRLSRGIDLSAMPVTRPETWALLKATTPETLKLLRRMHARSGIRRVDPIFVAETAEGIDALSHMRHVAMGFDIAVDRVTDAGLAGGAGFRVRDAVLLHRPQVEAAIAAWLDKTSVRRVDAREVTATLRRDGSARLDFSGTTLEAAHAVLADDTAIVSHLDASERDRTLLMRTATAILTEPARRLASPAMLYIDRGVTLMRERGGSLYCMSLGRADQAPARVASCLVGREPLRRAGQRVFQTIQTVDGAPMVGLARGVKATVIAGLGHGGVFLAPALARLIAGTPKEREKAYFAAREAARGNARTLVADFTGAAPLEAQL